MLTKTSAVDHNQYFRTVKDGLPKLYLEQVYELFQKEAASLRAYDKPLYLTAKSGITLLLLAGTTDQDITHFILHGTVKLKPRVRFALISIDRESCVGVGVHPEAHQQDFPLEEPVRWTPIARQADISEIYTIFHQVKKAPYFYPREQHRFCELTIVEQGELETTVDGVNYHLGPHDAILYQSHQIHSQAVLVDETTTYITILFEMDLDDSDFFNQVFHLTPQQLSQVEEFLRVSDMEDLAYKNDQLLAHLKLFILSLPSQVQASLSSASAMKEKFDNDVCQKITTYISDHPQLQVSDICQEFGVSRSYIQNLFQRFVHMTPHAYIDSQRLKQAKLLIRDSSYSLAEIGRMIGYQSLPSFSRKFKQTFGYTPSSYSKRLYKKI